MAASNLIQSILLGRYLSNYREGRKSEEMAEMEIYFWILNRSVGSEHLKETVMGNHFTLRFEKAIFAMKDLEISAKIANTILSKLLRQYNNDWEKIEEENYQILANAIFDHQQNTQVVRGETSSVTDNGRNKLPQKASVIENRDNRKLKKPVLPVSNYKKESALHVASSTCGEVNISLQFNDALRRNNTGNVNVNTVLRSVEQNLFKSSKDLGLSSEFSLSKLLKEVCEDFVRLQIPSSSSSSSTGTVTLKKKFSSGAGPSVVRDDLTNTNSKRRVSSDAGPKVLEADITKGNEKIRISLVNETGIREELPRFIYMKQSMVFQSAVVQISMARISDEECCKCEGDCLSRKIPCHCARDTRGEFAYTKEGLLTDKFLDKCISMHNRPTKHYHHFCDDCPIERAKNVFRPQKCKGHIVNDFIKECWNKCRCHQNCGNRVVQRGISRKLQVFMTNDGKGWGIRSLEDLPRGAFVCEYVGEILTNNELFDRNKNTGNERHTYPVVLDADWGSEAFLKDEEALCLDATYYGNVARFINHRCVDDHLIAIPVQIETPDHHYYHIAFFTKRKVKALEEITWDYGSDFADINHPIKAFKCTCGSSFCRDKRAKKAAKASGEKRKKIME